jgi:MFS family permease
VGEKYEIRKSYLVFHALVIPPAFLLALVTDIPMVVLSIFYFFFLLGMQPVENTLVAALTPPRLRHSAYGLKFILTFGVGALAVHMVGGIESAWGIKWVFPALGLVSVGIVLSILILIFRSKPVPPA